MKRDGGPVLRAHANPGDPNGRFGPGPRWRFRARKCAKATSWRDRGAKTVGKRYQPLKRQGVPQQQGRDNEKADGNPLRKCSPTREQVSQGAHKPGEEISDGTDKPFEEPFERIVGLGPSKHDAGIR